MDRSRLEQLVDLPSVETFASAVWRDWMTNEQADKLGAEMRAWVMQHLKDSQGEARQHAFDRDAPFCLRCGSTGETQLGSPPDAVQLEKRAREILMCFNKGYLGCKRDNELITEGMADDVVIRGDIAIRALVAALSAKENTNE